MEDQGKVNGHAAADAEKQPAPSVPNMAQAQSAISIATCAAMADPEVRAKISEARRSR